MGGGDVNVPGPTEEERALQRSQAQALEFQTALLQEQQRQNELLAPLLFENIGLKPIIDDSSIDEQIQVLQQEKAQLGDTVQVNSFGLPIPNNRANQIDQEIARLESQRGRITGFEEIIDPNEVLRDDIERGLLERTQAALRGELPVNPALLSDLETQERALREQLQAQLGPGFETSSAGIEALDEFATFKNELLEGARRADLTLAEQLGIQRERANEQRIDDLILRSTGITGINQPTAQLFGSNSAGFGDAQVPFQNQRNLELNAAIHNASQPSFGGELFGTAFGAATNFGFQKLFGV